MPQKRGTYVLHRKLCSFASCMTLDWIPDVIWRSSRNSEGEFYHDQGPSQATRASACQCVRTPVCGHKRTWGTSGKTTLSSIACIPTMIMNSPFPTWNSFRYKCPWNWIDDEDDGELQWIASLELPMTILIRRIKPSIHEARIVMTHYDVSSTLWYLWELPQGIASGRIHLSNKSR